jgi:hypothetical protein
MPSLRSRSKISSQTQSARSSLLLAYECDLATLCSQSTHGSTWQPQCGTTTVDFVMTPGDCFAGALAAPPEGALAVSRFGIQRMNGVRSTTSVTYQSFFAPSQRAPSAFTASFSAKGVTRFILIRPAPTIYFVAASTTLRA